MKIIKDIRIYKSNIDNIDGNSCPQDFASKTLNVKIHRVVMKLRENKFSFGNFDHLYLNFTTCLPSSRIEPAKRSVDCYHPWYRYYDIGVENDVYDNLGEIENTSIVLNGLRETLINYFSDVNTDQLINECIVSALQEGENMKILFKEKMASKNSARIYLRYLDNGMYWPLLCVYNLQKEEIFRADLPKMTELLSLGEIQLSSKKITIKPRKNTYTQKMKSITYEF